VNKLLELFQLLAARGKRYGKTFSSDRSKWDSKDRIAAQRFAGFDLSRNLPFAGMRRNKKAKGIKKDRELEQLIRELFEDLPG